MAKTRVKRKITPLPAIPPKKSGLKLKPITPRTRAIRTLVSFAQYFGDRVQVEQKEMEAWVGLKNRSARNKLGPLGDRSETRGRNRKLTEADLDRMEDILECEGFNYRILPWEELAKEAHIAGISERTIRRRMNERGISTFKACRRSWCKTKHKNQRREWFDFTAGRNLRTWQSIRYSDEVHFGLSTRRTLYIRRRKGARYHCDCIQRDPWSLTGKEKDKIQIPKLHAWASIGYNHKSPLVFYETGSTNGKMSGSVYINQVLEPLVAVWIDRGEEFMLEEDNDSGHGPGKKMTAVKRWKEKHGLHYYFNPPSSPDMSPIESVWRILKQRLSADNFFDYDSLKERILQIWEEISLEEINKLVMQMPDRRDALKDAGFERTGY